MNGKPSQLAIVRGLIWSFLGRFWRIVAGVVQIGVGGAIVNVL